MKVVLDTNVLLAGFCFGGICRSVLQVCLDDHDVILSEWILREVHQHLTGKFRHSKEQADERLYFLRESTTVLELIALPVVKHDRCRDLDDLFILAAAQAGQADCLVTGDNDLLDLGAHDGIAILTPRQFWERLRKG